MSSSQSFVEWVAEHPVATGLMIMAAVVWLRRMIITLAVAAVVAFVVVGVVVTLGGVGH